MTEQIRPEETYIINESLEISVGEAKGWTHKFFTVFPALSIHNYRLYFIGQLVSLIGTWLQTVAQGWLVLQLTNSPFLVGLVAAMGSLPTLFFALFGGVIVDRFDTRKILIFTQAASTMLATMMGVLTLMGHITVVNLTVLAFLMGLVSAVDIPARQSFAVEMVGKEHLASAIALNAGVFNGARVIGPAIAGFLISLVGWGGAFVINGASYIAALVALLYIHVKDHLSSQNHPHPLRAIQQGINYAFFHKTIRILLLFTGVTSVFGWSYTIIMPVIAKHVFHLDVAGLGFLYAATGLGALVAAVFVSAFAKKTNPLVLILGGNALFATSLIAFSFTTSLITAVPFLFLAGMGLIAQFSTMNTTIQHLVHDEVRGRVMSIYALMFLGMTPLGSFQIGWMADHFGPQFAVRFGAVIVLLVGLLLYFNLSKLQESLKHS